MFKIDTIDARFFVNLFEIFIISIYIHASQLFIYLVWNAIYCQQKLRELRKFRYIEILDSHMDIIVANV